MHHHARGVRHSLTHRPKIRSPAKFALLSAHPIRNLTDDLSPPGLRRRADTLVMWRTSPPRPRSLLLTFVGGYADGADQVVAAASVTDLFEAVGVGTSATRATLSRVVAGAAPT